MTGDRSCSGTLFPDAAGELAGAKRRAAAGYTCLNGDAAMPTRGDSSNTDYPRFTEAEMGAAFELPEKYAGYSLVGRVGWGGGGDVWKAQDEYGNTIAFKVLSGSVHATQDQIQRFAREGQILANLHHDGICHVRDIDRVGKTLYIAMEYIDGIGLDKLINFLTNPTTALTVKLNEADTENLGAIIDTIDRTTSRFDAADRGRQEKVKSAPTKILPLQQCLAIVMKVCDAIQFAHERGVLHRDIKPSNIMIRRDGEPVVLDFGIAKTHDEMRGTLTQTGEIFGTIEYMAPEQAHSSRDVDERTDVYSIGAVLYQLVTGRRHFVRSGNIYQDITQLKALAPVRPRAYSRDIDRDLEAIILKALAPAPADRYRSAKQLREDLARYQAGEPVRAKRFTWTYLLAKWAARHKVPLAFSSVTLVLFLSFCGYFAWNYYRQWGRWVRVYHRDFGDGAYPPGDFVFTGRETRDGMPWTVDSLGLLMRRFGTLWLSDVRVPGDVRVVVRMRFEDVPDGFEIMANAADDTLPTWSYLPRGYSCQFGGYFGSLASVSVNREPGVAAKSTVAPVYPRLGKVYELMFERHGRRVALWVDGREVVAMEEPVPLHGGEYGRIGLRCYTTTVHIVGIDIYHLSLPEKAPPLVAGDALLSAGAPEAAIRSYLSVARDHRGTALGEQALARALLAAMRLAPARRDTVVAKLRPHFVSEYPESKLRRVIEEAEIMSRWYAEEYDTAVRQLTAHCERYPSTALVQRIIDAAPDSLKLFLLDRVPRLAGLRKVDVSGVGLSNLGALESCDLYGLNCSGNRTLRDLTPLQSMASLAWLDCSGNAVGDLGPLSGKPLVYLDASHNRLEDIGCLSGLPLRYLSVGDNDLVLLPPFERNALKVLMAGSNGITDLGALEGLELHKAAVDYNAIADLGPLAGMPLEFLACSHNRITSLEPLRGMPLVELYCSDNKIADLAPVAELSLELLNISRNPVGNAEALRGKRLKKLWGKATGLRSVDPLRGQPLEVLDIASNRITSLEPVGACPLRSLACDNNPISSLGELRGMPLRSLSCGDCRLGSLAGIEELPLTTLVIGNRHEGGNAVETLEPLRGLRLEHIDLMHNRVTSLEPLRDMPLRYVNCQDNPLRSLGPFVGRPPETFFFYSEQIGAGELVRARDGWARDSTTAHHARRAEIYLRIRRGQWGRLRELGREHAGRRYLQVPIFRRPARAAALCDSMGGHLVTIGSEEELAFVDRLGEGTVLTGAHRLHWRWRWCTGEPFDVARFRRQIRYSRAEDRYLTVRDGRLTPEQGEVRRQFVVEWDE